MATSKLNSSSSRGAKAERSIPEIQTRYHLRKYFETQRDLPEDQGPHASEDILKTSDNLETGAIIKCSSEFETQPQTDASSLHIPCSNAPVSEISTMPSATRNKDLPTSRYCKKPSTTETNALANSINANLPKTHGIQYTNWNPKKQNLSSSSGEYVYSEAEIEGKTINLKAKSSTRKVQRRTADSQIEVDYKSTYTTPSAIQSSEREGGKFLLVAEHRPGSFLSYLELSKEENESFKGIASISEVVSMLNESESVKIYVPKPLTDSDYKKGIRHKYGKKERRPYHNLKAHLLILKQGWQSSFIKTDFNGKYECIIFCNAVLDRTHIFDPSTHISRTVTDFHLELMKPGHSKVVETPEKSEVLEPISGAKDLYSPSTAIEVSEDRNCKVYLYIGKDRFNRLVYYSKTVSVFEVIFPKVGNDFGTLELTNLLSGDRIGNRILKNKLNSVVTNFVVSRVVIANQRRRKIRKGRNVLSQSTNTNWEGSEPSTKDNYFETDTLEKNVTLPPSKEFYSVYTVHSNAQKVTHVLQKMRKPIVQIKSKEIGGASSACLASKVENILRQKNCISLQTGEPVSRTVLNLQTSRSDLNVNFNVPTVLPTNISKNNVVNYVDHNNDSLNISNMETPGTSGICSQATAKRLTSNLKVSLPAMHQFTTAQSSNKSHVEEEESPRTAAQNCYSRVTTILELAQSNISIKMQHNDSRHETPSNESEIKMHSEMKPLPPSMWMLVPKRLTFAHSSDSASHENTPFSPQNFTLIKVQPPPPEYSPARELHSPLPQKYSHRPDQGVSLANISQLGIASTDITQPSLHLNDIPLPNLDTADKTGLDLASDDLPQQNIASANIPQPEISSGENHISRELHLPSLQYSPEGDPLLCGNSLLHHPDQQVHVHAPQDFTDNAQQQVFQMPLLIPSLLQHQNNFFHILKLSPDMIDIIPEDIKELFETHYVEIFGASSYEDMRILSYYEQSNDWGLYEDMFGNHERHKINKP